MGKTHTHHPSYLGDTAEVLLLAELVSRGLNVSVPFGSNQLYDLVVEHGKSKKLLKVQVKFQGAVEKNCVSYRFKKVTRYKGRVDVFACLCGADWACFGADQLASVNDVIKVNTVTDVKILNNFNVFGV